MMMLVTVTASTYSGSVPVTPPSTIAAWSHPDTMQPAQAVLLTSALCAAASSSGEEDPGTLMGSPEAEYEDWWPRPSVHHSLLLHLVNVQHNCSLKG